MIIAVFGCRKVSLYLHISPYLGEEYWKPQNKFFNMT